MGLTPAGAARANRSYLKNVAEVDVVRVDPSQNDPHAHRPFHALARNIAMEHKIPRLRWWVAFCCAQSVRVRV